MGVVHIGFDGRVIEDLTDQIDGLETVFTTSYKYRLGTLAVKINGLDQGPASVAFTELTNQTFEFSVFVLRTPDMLLVHYIPEK